MDHSAEIASGRTHHSELPRPGEQSPEYFPLLCSGAFHLLDLHIRSESASTTSAYCVAELYPVGASHKYQRQVLQEPRF